MCATALCDPPAPRSWTDASGGFRVDAALVRVVGDRVVLLSADGKELEVLRERLSAADREWIEKRLAAPDHEALPPERSAARAHLVLTLESQTAGDQLLIGTVFAQDDEHRYIAVTQGAARGLDNSQLHVKGEIHAVVELGDTLRRVPVKRATYDSQGNRLIVFGPKDQLPAPFQSTKKLSVARGDVFRFYGFELQSRQQGGGFSRRESEAVVRHAFIDYDAKPHGFSVELSKPLPCGTGILVNQHGEAVALASGALEQTAPFMPRGTPAKFATFFCETPDGLRSTFEPRLVALGVRKLGGVRTFFDLQAMIFDHSSRASSKKLKLLYRPLNPFRRDLDKFTLKDGVWIDKPPEGGNDIDLTRKPVPSDGFKQTLVADQWPQLVAWTAQISKPAGMQSDEILCQCVVVDEQGRYQPLGEPMSVRLE